jgi:hypothetical protein
MTEISGETSNKDWAKFLNYGGSDKLIAAVKKVGGTMEELRKMGKVESEVQALGKFGEYLQIRGYQMNDDRTIEKIGEKGKNKEEARPSDLDSEEDENLRYIDGLTEEDFMAMFKGKDTFGPTGEGWESAWQWLTTGSQKVILRKAKLSITFLEKPRLFLITGRTKDGAGDGEGIDQRLSIICPKLEEGSTVGPKRNNWGQWKNVNFSCMRRAAYLAITSSYFKKQDFVIKWKMIYGNAPDEITVEELNEVIPEGKTRDIRVKEIIRFQKEKIFWEKLIKE